MISVSVLLHYIVLGEPIERRRWAGVGFARVPLSGEAQEWTELNSSNSIVAVVVVVLLTDFDFVIPLSLCLSYKYAGENKDP